MIDVRVLQLMVIAIAVSLLVSAAGGTITAAVQHRRNRDAQRACARAIALPLAVGPGAVGLFMLTYGAILMLLTLLVSALAGVFLLVGQAFGLGHGPHLILRSLGEHGLHIALPGAALTAVAAAALNIVVRSLGGPLRGRHGSRDRTVRRGSAPG